MGNLRFVLLVLFSQISLEIVDVEGIVEEGVELE